MIEPSFIDIPLVIWYAVLLEILIRYINKKINHNNPKLSGYFINGFRLKLLLDSYLAFFPYSWSLQILYCIIPAEWILKKILFENTVKPSFFNQFCKRFRGLLWIQWLQPRKLWLFKIWRELARNEICSTLFHIWIQQLPGHQPPLSGIFIFRPLSHV